MMKNQLYAAIAFISLGLILFLIIVLKTIIPSKISNDKQLNNDSTLIANDLIGHVLNDKFVNNNIFINNPDSIFNYVFFKELKNHIDTVIVFEWTPEKFHFYAITHDSTFVYELKDNKVSKYFLFKVF